MKQLSQFAGMIGLIYVDIQISRSFGQAADQLFPQLNISVQRQAIIFAPSLPSFLPGACLFSTGESTLRPRARPD